MQANRGEAAFAKGAVRPIRTLALAPGIATRLQVATGPSGDSVRQARQLRRCGCPAATMPARFPDVVVIENVTASWMDAY